MTGVPIPSWPAVALTVVFVAITGAVIARRRLALERELAFAVVRAAVQLVAVGWALVFIFEHTGIPGSFGWVGGMVVLAGRTAAGRARGLPHAVRSATAGIGVGAALTLGVLFGVRILSAQPRVIVPIGGMVVGAAMQGATIVLARVRDEVASARPLVEARLALGLPGHEAFAPHARAALRASIGPAIDQTKVVGLITLPGAMTGLIIAGIPPLLAIRYQIVVMYMWLGAASVAGLVAAQLAERALFDEAHRLRPLVPVRPTRGLLRRAA